MMSFTIQTGGERGVMSFTIHTGGRGVMSFTIHTGGRTWCDVIYHTYRRESVV